MRADLFAYGFLETVFSLFGVDTIRHEVIVLLGWQNIRTVHVHVYLNT